MNEQGWCNINERIKVSKDNHKGSPAERFDIKRTNLNCFNKEKWHKEN